MICMKVCLFYLGTYGDTIFTEQINDGLVMAGNITA